MGKKCIPGMFCIGNMTLFLVCLMFLCILYLYMRVADLGKKDNSNSNSFPVIMVNPNPNPNPNPLTNLYAPPIRNDTDFLVKQHLYDIRPIATQPFDPTYHQIGILTRKTGNSEILPLMGRRQLTSRNKWKYYTMTGNNIQTKLPVSVNGKSCTGEYGCEEIMNNDTVFVEGFKDIFIATIYENNTFEYMP
jgi:hypothetical protein